MRYLTERECVFSLPHLKVSGLSSWVATLLTPLGDLPVIATVTIACVIVTSITEVASNAATITIFLPILAPLVGSLSSVPLLHSSTYEIKKQRCIIMMIVIIVDNSHH